MKDMKDENASHLICFALSRGQQFDQFAESQKKQYFRPISNPWFGGKTCSLHTGLSVTRKTTFFVSCVKKKGKKRASMS